MTTIQTRKKCPKGEIRIQSYTTKRGTKVKSYCKKDLGKPGKGKKLFTLKKGELSKYGCHLTKPRQERQNALKKAMKKFDRNTMIRKLNALSILQKNTNPNYSRKAKTDMTFIQKCY